MRLLFLVVMLCFSVCAETHSQTLGPANFGMNYANAGGTDSVQSKVSPGIRRVWVQWSIIATCRPTNATNPADACYNWGTFDGMLATNVATGSASLATLVSVPGWANGSQANSVPPTSFVDFYAFCTAAATRAAGKIAYWNPWNEMDAGAAAGAGAYWTGTIAQAVTFVTGCRSAIKAVFPNAIVTAPNVTSYGTVWFQQYMAAGGAAIADGVDIHTYPNLSTSSLPATIPPESASSTLAIFQTAINYFGLGSLPTFSSEGGYSTLANTPLPIAMKWCGAWPILMPSSGIQYPLWYSYDDSTWGTLSANGTTLTACGNAYREATKWLMSATFSSPMARVANTNQVRNPGGSGAVTTTPGACPNGGTGGTPPTHWALQNNDTANGVSMQIVGSGTEGGVSYVDVRTCGTPSGGAVGAAGIYFEASNQIAATYKEQFNFGADIKLVAGSTNLLTSLLLQMSDQDSGGSFLSTDMYQSLYPIPSPLATSPYNLAAPTTSSSVAFVQPALVLLYAPGGGAFDITLRIGNVSIDNGSLWSGNITKASGYQGQIIWDSAGGPTSYTASNTYTFQRNASGQSSPIVGNSVTLTGQPIILENQQWSGWTP